jgi:hypothetical protein
MVLKFFQKFQKYYLIDVSFLMILLGGSLC